VEAGYIPPAIKGLEPPTLTVFLHKQKTQIAAYFLIVGTYFKNL
jgi:hypothetical protein